MIYKQKYISPMGDITLTSDGTGLSGLYFEGQRFVPCTKGKPIEKELPVFKNAALWLDEYFGGGIPSFVPELAAKGSEFQRSVWEILLKIPYGTLITYGDIARELAARRGIPRMSAQAVGSAVGHNPVSIIIPCHRVVASDGKIGGYDGGVQLKTKLLAIEGIALDRFKNIQ